jgi:RNA polymerase sigma-70 factor (ECF subfamily)
MVNDPDGDLVARAGQGDRAAAQLLVHRHLPKMFSLARRMLGDNAAAEDAVQDAFLRLWTHAPRWRPGAARFETWLYRVTLNQCYDRLRRRKNVALDEASEVADATPDPETQSQAVRVSEHVQAVLATLPERQRAAVVLCHFDGCGNIEAAEILGVSVEALESLLARGRRTLKERLQYLRD